MEDGSMVMGKFKSFSGDRVQAGRGIHKPICLS
jgi:hypothetical protein